MTVDKQSVLALVGTQEIDVKRAQITLDESWAPYAQATIECPYDPALMAALDPRNDVRVSLVLEQQFGDSDTVAALSTQFAGAGKKCSNVTTAWSGLYARDITAMHHRPWNSGALRASKRRTFDMTLRRRPVNHASKTLSLQLTSDEALLQDYALVSNVSYQPSTTSVRTLVTYVLAKIGRYLQAGTDDGAIVASSAEWLPGVTAWDYLTPLLQTAGLRLWCDEQRNWYLTTDTSAASTADLLALSYLGTIVDTDDDITRDGDWYDAVVIVYSWTDATNVPRKAYDAASSPGFSKVLTLNYTTPFPGPGAAARVLSRANGKGHQQSVRAVSDFDAQPRIPVSVTTPDGFTQSGVLSSITWNLPESQMDVKTRGLTETPPYAWILDPSGLSWNSIPVGIDWSEDI